MQDNAVGSVTTCNPCADVFDNYANAGVKAVRIGKVNLIEGVIDPQPRSDVQLACSNHADDVLDFAGAGR
ncbi:hypothetical protein MFFC18_18050 [Mariniblastus fucicola]|uniref:Uncharacterized protein n=2 Tax=Mariniblastus fucicola TaxID=980251 RepID=A0A5B9P6P4_9BACT|nr:hypothetical protein MFFC18_18050 [Mariniblastus fucicola]